jgi:hypothetical protein
MNLRRTIDKRDMLIIEELFQIKETEMSCEDQHVFMDNRTHRVLRVAKIHFLNNRFDKVEFTLKCNPYSFEDWLFLAEVAKEVISEVDERSLKNDEAKR